MLRPATPLAITFFVAFALLLISVLSTPIIKAIPLGSYQGYNFGVFGYCHGNTECVGPKIGYDTSSLFPGGSGDFPFNSGSRNVLSGILIVHPIAAFFVLVCLGLAIAAHFQRPSHSPRFLLSLLILTIPTLLLTLLAFLVDILLFIPHLQWGVWIVLAATILMLGSLIITCAMRRTLVSRKARKKRIAENADMNGANYYDGLAEQRMMQDQLPRADSPPPLSGTTAGDKAGPQFATFEMKSRDPSGQDARMRSDDRLPLNPTRDPSVRSASTGGGSRIPHNSEDAPPMPMGGRNGSMDSTRPRRPSRDQYGVPIAGAAIGMAGDLPPPGLRHHSSQGSLGSNRSGGYGRGRGYGAGPGPRGNGPPRGGYGAPRGGYGPRGGFRGGPGGPPPGFMGRGRGYGPPRGGLPPRPGPPPGYVNDQYYAQPPPMQDEFVAGPNIAIGQAIEMDERTGTSSPPHAGYPLPNNGPLHAGYEPPANPPHAGFEEPPHAGYAGFSQGPYGVRDSDSDVAGMVGLQQGRQRAPPNVRRPSGASSSPSVYSGHEQPYIPPRADWARDSPAHARGPPPPVFRQPSNDSRAISPVAASPQSQHTIRPQHRRNGSEAYYEDVDPRFAAPASGPLDSAAIALPASLTPGGPPPPGAGGNAAYAPAPAHPLPPTLTAAEAEERDTVPTLNFQHHQNSSSSLQLLGSSVDEHIPDGARSPAEGSDTSHYTSISQRPVNPNWRPDTSNFSQFGGAAPPVRRRAEDVVLNANPDFSLSVPGGRGRGRGYGRGGGGMARGPMDGGAGGLTPAGRYPGVEFQ